MKNVLLKYRAVLAALCLLAASFFAAPASAQYGLPTFTIGADNGSTTVVGFGGHQWYVTKDSSTPTSRSVELLYKWDDTTNFGAVSYNSSEQNDYGGGQLQLKMADIVDGFSSQEQAVLTARNITDVNGVVDNQKLWALSLDEWNAVAGDALNFPSTEGFENCFWLRSPHPPPPSTMRSSASPASPAGIPTPAESLIPSRFVPLSI